MLNIFCGCGASRYVTTEIQTTTHTIDTLIVRDTTVIHTESVLKDYAIVPDTLHLVGQHSSATAYLDTTTTIIKGTLKEDPWKEKIVFKDKLVYRDSIVTKEVPVEVEVIKKVIPKWCWYSLGLNLLFLLILAVKLYLKFKP